MAVKELKDSEKVIALKIGYICLKSQFNDTETGNAITQILKMVFPEEYGLTERDAKDDAQP